MPQHQPAATKLIEVPVLILAVTASCFAILFAPLVSFGELTWHDQQRLTQAWFLFLAFFGLVNFPSKLGSEISVVWIRIGAGVITLGTLSATQSAFPLWAMTEVALLAASLGGGAFIYALAKRYPSHTDFGLALLVRVLLGAMVLQFYVSFIAVFGHPELYFTPWSLLDGFSNMRHEGQFLTIAVPLLGASLFTTGEWQTRYPRWLDNALLVSLASMVFVAGTRGTVAAWLIVATIFAFFKGEARALSKRFLITLVMGFVLAWLMLYLAAIVTNQASELRSELLGLSAREIIWQLALDKTLENPWLGVGPMHFAALKSPIAAHPHQAILQISSEWGIPTFLLVAAAFLLWMFKSFRIALAEDGNSHSELRWCILFSITASAVQSMVDGVLVMPYPQIWLTITIAWGCAKFYSPPSSPTYQMPRALLLSIFGAAVLWLAWVAWLSYPELVGASEYCSGGPRFWCNGRLENNLYLK